jgi:hypothetical protein
MNRARDVTSRFPSLRVDSLRLMDHQVEATVLGFGWEKDDGQFVAVASTSLGWRDNESALSLVWPPCSVRARRLQFAGRRDDDNPGL